MSKFMCTWGQCGSEAKYQIGLCLWPLQMPTFLRNDGNCVKVLSSITICHECSRRLVRCDDFMTIEGKERIASGLMRAGKACPDFTRVRFEFIEIIDAPIDLIKHIPPGANIIEA